ncbi:hypothetical protein G7062_11250 [Erysipelothrix sp. HDW6C]|uniref:hypothetical protein n=1 Tax=Erysipelothrix sp. HDW6C TaxID=2714930 RepID=UPI001409BC49|nr:hypothetical protein [Erysipelothrix sp. HDW6C]QIK70835.1 hypothetical protein G7062_11250 [Erysipelothrix sp. HDW6C]
MISDNFTVEINDIEFNILTDLSVLYEKLWSEDTGRTYKDGEFMGTLIGIFPKLEIEFAPKTSEELSNLIRVCNSPRQTIKWYNPLTKEKATSVFYSNSFGVSLRKALAGNYDRIKVNFISTKRGA